MLPLLKIENLSIQFYSDNQDEAWKMENVSFEVKKNQVVALVGESGSGKSTIAHSILQLLDRRKLRYFNGKVIFENQNFLELNENQIRKIRGNRISMIFQDPMTSLNPTHTILRQVSESMILHQKISIKVARDRSLELLEKVGLSNPESFLSCYPHQISGGERQRVMIAMAIANHPLLLIADEPTTALDVTTQAKIIALLEDLKKKLDLTLLFISHDLNLVKSFADKIIVMKDGKVVEQGDTQKIVTNPQHEYTRTLFNALSKPLVERKSNAEIILKVDKINVKYPIHSFLFKRVKGYKHSVKNISFQLPQSRTLGIIGESGSGKTSLIMAILRMIKSEGCIQFNGVDINTLSKQKLRSIRKNFQVVFQDSFSSLNPRFTIGENISEGLEIHERKLNAKEKQEKVNKVLEEVGLNPQNANSFPHEFSGGQRQRINIARALILNPYLVLLDEPTSSLDVTLENQIIELLFSLQEKKKLSYIFISHDLKVIRSIADFVLVMKDGQAMEYASNHELFTNPQNPYTKSLLEASLDFKI